MPKPNRSPNKPRYEDHMNLPEQVNPPAAGDDHGVVPDFGKPEDRFPKPSKKADPFAGMK